MRRSGIGALQLGASGIAFVLYPVLRGYGSEVGMQGAVAYARYEWVIAHLLGMVGFALLAVGLAVVDARASRWAIWGAFAVLPYYGAETFGLHALGVRVLQTGHADMIEAVDMFRYQPLAVTVFAIGLLLFAIVGGRLLLLALRGSGLQRWGLLLVGLALVTYLPQFFLPGPARMAHGVVLGLGLVLTAVVAATSPGTRASAVPVGDSSV